MTRSRRTADPKTIVKKQKKAFKQKFERNPSDGDPLFFDPDLDTPQPLKPEKVEKEVLAAMKKAALPAELIYAYKKTGFLVMESMRGRYSAEDLAEWNAAIAEYERLESHQAKTDAKPDLRTRVIPPTRLPELLESPFTQEDEEAISKCLDALDEVLAVTSMSVRARMELGAGLLALACDHAFDAQISDGGTPEDGHKFAIALANIALARVQEIYEGMDHGDDNADA